MRRSAPRLSPMGRALAVLTDRRLTLAELATELGMGRAELPTLRAYLDRQVSAGLVRLLPLIDRWTATEEGRQAGSRAQASAAATAARWSMTSLEITQQRRQIIEQVLSATPRTLAELTSLTGLSPVCIGQHLRHLCLDGVAIKDGTKAWRRRGPRDGAMSSERERREAATQKRLADHQARVLAVLDAGECSAEQLAARCGLLRSAVEKSLGKLRAKRQVVYRGKGHVWALTPAPTTEPPPPEPVVEQPLDDVEDQPVAIVQPPPADLASRTLAMRW